MRFASIKFPEKCPYRKDMDGNDDERCSHKDMEGLECWNDHEFPKECPLDEKCEGRITPDAVAKALIEALNQNTRGIRDTIMPGC
jgi:hypothetical protein